MKMKVKHEDEDGNVDEEDVQVKFMHPASPFRSSQWPHVDDGYMSVEFLMIIF